MKKRLSLIVFASLLLVAYQNCSRPKTQYTVLNSLTNYITNASFERGMTGYNKTGPGTAEALPDAAQAGTLGLRLFQAAVEPESLPAMNPNKVYLLSFWARSVVQDPNGAVEPYPHAQVNTGFMSLTSPGTYVPETVNKIKIKSSVWEKYEYVIEPGDMAGHYWKLSLSLTSSDGSNNVVDFDELTLEEVQVEP